MISLFQLPRDEKNEWPADLRAAVAAYPRVQNSPTFEANFWHKLDARRSHAATLRGKIEHFAQVQIGGLCVWRLLGSTMAGAALPALALCLMLTASGAAKTQLVPVKAPPFSALAWRELERQWNWKFPFKAQSQLIALWLDGATSLQGGSPCPNVV